MAAHKIAILVPSTPFLSGAFQKAGCNHSFGISDDRCSPDSSYGERSGRHPEFREGYSEAESSHLAACSGYTLRVFESSSLRGSPRRLEDSNAMIWSPWGHPDPIS